MSEHEADSPELARPELREKPTVILGGGPAGLTAGYLLAKQGLPVVVLEAEDQVGGIAKTAVRDGYRFDLGGHRFFTKVQEVDDLWHEIMKEEFLKRPRMSRIYWRDRHGEAKFLDYPLRGPDVMKKLGPIDLTRALVSYLWAAVKPKGKEETYEEWVSNRFGKFLFNQFFKSYTEKVWGVPTSEIRADWAAQRIKNLSFFRAAWSAFFGNRGNKVTSLISEFNYPRYGPGQMWEQMTEDIEQLGGKVLLNHRVTKLEFDGDRCVRVHVADGQVFEPSAVISSLPLRNTVGMADPQPAARGDRRRARPALPRLPHRLRGARRRGPLPGQLDLHPRPERERRAASRTSAPGARGWSPTRARPAWASSSSASPATSMWEMDDDELVQLGMRELEQLGLARSGPARVRLRRSACPRPTRCTTPTTPSACTRSARGSTASTTSSRSAATACTATTTRITRCSPPCARWTTS